MVILGCWYACWQWFGSCLNHASVLSAHSPTSDWSSVAMLALTSLMLGIRACCCIAQCRVGSKGSGCWLCW